MNVNSDTKVISSSLSTLKKVFVYIVVVLLFLVFIYQIDVLNMIKPTQVEEDGISADIYMQQQELEEREQKLKKLEKIIKQKQTNLTKLTFSKTGEEEEKVEKNGYFKKATQDVKVKLNERQKKIIESVKSSSQRNVSEIRRDSFTSTTTKKQNTLVKKSKQYRQTSASSPTKPASPCYKNIFKDTLLVMNFNYPYYGNNKILHKLYDDVFGKVLTCGPAPDDKNSSGPDILYKEEQIWYFRYRCLTKAIVQFPGYAGYIYSNDDLIINWWNLLKLDRKKVWQSGTVDWRQKAFGPIVNNAWVWWNTNMGIEACQKYYTDLKKLAQSNPNEYKRYLDVYLSNSEDEPRCAKGWSDMFYVPGQYAQGYVKLSDIAYKNKLFLEIAGNNIIRTLDRIDQFEHLNGTYLPDLYVGDLSAAGFKRVYNKKMTFIHPVKLNSKSDKDKIQSIIRNEIVEYKNLLTKC